MRKILLTVLILLGIQGMQVFAQTKTIENVSNAYLKNMGPIINDSEVKGYYMFYRTDKLDSKTYSYDLAILDQNLNAVNTKSITGSAYLNLIEGVYNEDALIMKFYDGKTKEIIIQIFDKQGNLASESKRVATKTETYTLAAATENSSPSLFSIDKVGAADYRMVKNASYGYEIEFIPSKAGINKWTYASDVKSKEVQIATFIYGDENVVINSIIKKPNILSNSVDMEVLGINTKTGEKMFQIRLDDAQYELMVLNGFGSDNAGNVYLFGSYYAKGDKEFKSASLGLFSAKVDLTGNLKSKKLVSWEGDISKFLSVDLKGKMKGNFYTYFHDIVRNKDGNIYAIGEQYRKQVSALGVASKVLNRGGGGVSASEMAVEDMVILEFDKDFSLKNVNVIEKERNIIALPEGAGIYGPVVLSNLVKAYGGFDFEFLQMNKDKSVITISYLDYVNVKGADDKYVLGAATYSDSKYSIDKIDVRQLSRGNTIKVFPGKTGNFMVMEYNRKLRNINLRLEKINF
jgi:hypothetical protein